jgi:hypothetical protein
MTVWDSLHSLLDFECLLFHCDEWRTKNSLRLNHWILLRLYQSESESYVTTDGQPASLSWNKAPFLGLRPDLYHCLTVADLLILGALSVERMGLSFTIPAGPRQRSHFRVRVPYDSWPYLTVSDSRLPFSSPPTTRRVWRIIAWTELTSRRTEYRSPSPTLRVLVCFIRCHGNVCLASRWLAMDLFIAAGTFVTEPLPSNGHIRHNIMILSGLPLLENLQ